MSIIVHGTIVIARKSGRRGDFNVGDLSTEIGEFEVKDACIEEFDPGKYTGRFVIDWIQPDSFTYRGRVFVKNRAKLAEILIDEGEVGDQKPAPTPEPDPIETEGGAQRAQASLPQQPSEGAVPMAPAHKDAYPPGSDATASAKADQAADDADPDHALFGAEINALVIERAAVKLDPTVDRALFRRQRDRLKALGYGFDPKAQAWSRGDDIPF